MLTDRERQGIRELLNLVPHQVLVRLNRRIVDNIGEAIIAGIIEDTPDPLHLLRRKTLLKLWIQQYITSKNIYMRSTSSKQDYINACLTIWGSQIPPPNPRRIDLPVRIAASAISSALPSGSATAATIAASPNLPSNHSSASSATPTEPGAASAVPTEKGRNDSSLDTEGRDKDCLCKICWEREVEVVFFPCGHVASCEQCAATMAACAMCRSNITQKVRIYI